MTPRFSDTHATVDAAIAAALEDITRQAEHGLVPWMFILLVTRAPLGGHGATEVQAITIATGRMDADEDDQVLWGANRFAKIVGADCALQVEDGGGDVRVFVECTDAIEGVLYVARRDAANASRLGPFVVAGPHTTYALVPGGDPNEPEWGAIGVDMPLLSFGASQRFAWLTDSVDDS